MDFLFHLLPPELSLQFSTIISFITLIFYLVECFSGYRLIRSWISLLGFLLGVIGGFKLCTIFFDQTSYAVLGAIILGTLLSALSYKVYLAGIFCIAAYNVFQICLTILPLEAEFLYLSSLLLGLFAGYLGGKYMRPAIIIITAFHGGIMAADLLSLFLTLPAQLTTLTCGLFIGTIGSVFQFLRSKK